MSIPAEDFRSIARILAAGYLRLRDQRRRESPLDSPPTSSPHGHEVNGLEKGETRGDRDAKKEIEELSRMTVGQLRQKYLEVFGEESRSNHKQFLFRRIAWRIQALAEGGLSERARRRALEIANDADLRIRAPRTRFGQDATLDPKLSVTPQGGGRSRSAAAAARVLPRARVQRPASHREGPGGRVRVRRPDLPVPERHRPRGRPAPSGMASSSSTWLPTEATNGKK